VVFTSPVFLGLFIPALLALYFWSNYALRTYVLLAFSLLFYSWGEPIAVWVMIALAVFGYFIGMTLGFLQGRRLRLSVLAVGVGVNLVVLGFYKYLSFFIGNVLSCLAFFGADVHLPDPNIALPIGISFYTFQILSYLVDVYRKEVLPQRNLFKFMLYVSLFPQLIAGPIVRYATIVSQLEDRVVHFDNIIEGVRRFAIGLAKKAIIADSMAVIADGVFKTDPAAVPCVYCWLGAIAYMLQIYFDFSGYSDMAIGLGRIFNFRFLENFKHPYAACSVQDFWRRWHVSLSTWFRDYLYIPLGGNRKGPVRTYVNLFIVFALCGLWHGASWTFVVWGLYHGIGLVMERSLLKSYVERLPRFIGNAYLLLFVLVGWVFFRADTLSHAGQYLRNMFLGNWALGSASFMPLFDHFSLSNAFLLIVGIFVSYPIMSNAYARCNDSVKTCLCIPLLALSVIWAMTSGYSPFIYFRF